MILRFFAVILFMIMLGCAGLWQAYHQALTTPVVINDSQIISIEKGDSFNRITHKLQAKNIAVKPLWFKLIAYQNKVIDKLKAGEYNLKKGLTMPEILTLMVAGKSRQYSITFPEGWSFKQIVQKMADTSSLEKTLDNKDFQDIMALLSSDYQHPEGLFFPDTYFYNKNTTDFALLKRAYHKMQQVLAEEWANKEKNLPLKNAYQALILASIVEKETGVTSERPEIAGVFTRRLNKGMRLQTDPTVIYGMGEKYQGNIRKKDLRQATAYNTYVIKGLPPTPIAMPGQAAIRAVLHPNKGKSLYFVAKGDGSHIFSETLRAHNNAVNTFQRNR